MCNVCGTQIVHRAAAWLQVASAEADTVTLQARCEHLTHALSSLEDTQGQATDVLQTAEQQIAIFDAKCSHLEGEWQTAATKRCAGLLLHVGDAACVSLMLPSQAWPMHTWRCAEMGSPSMNDGQRARA